MDTNFEHYKVFYYVAKYGNLTKAAAVLKTSQPAVTRTIHNLENILGCRLFIRSKSGMKLTPEGNICLIDFNISATLDGDTAWVTGYTNGYAAPEQIEALH